MPSPGEFLDDARRGHDWHSDPWLEHYLERPRHRGKFSKPARLWLPVIVSFLVQVPAVFLTHYSCDVPAFTAKLQIKAMEALRKIVAVT